MRRLLTPSLGLLLLLALTAGDVAWARGGGGGGGGRGGGLSGRSSRDAQRRVDRRNKDKKLQRVLRDRALAENRDAIRRDGRVDSE